MNKHLQYMELCDSIAKIFSTCEKKKYGSVILDNHGYVIGFGYNGAPKGITHCSDGNCPRLLEGSASGSVYDNCIAVHAEANALLHSDHSSNGKTMYVNGPPCFSCAKLICNSTVDTVVYKSDSSYANWSFVKSFLESSKIQLIEVGSASI